MPVPLSPDAAAGHHLLLLPAGVGPADVEALTSSRFPEGRIGDADRGRVRFEVFAGAAVEGPWAPPEGILVVLPTWVESVYRLEVRPERGGPVPFELRGRGGFLDAFAGGEPLGDERQLLELAMAIARRLGGAVRAAGPDGALVVPSPLADLLVYTDVWLHPDALVHVLAPHLPGLGLPSIPDGPQPLPPDAVISAPDLLADEGRRRWLHAEADAYDAAALAEPEVTEAYGATANLSDGSVVSVTVEAVPGVPVVLAGHPWDAVICYELRCYPSEPGRDLPADAVELVDGAARALLASVGGRAVDDDGFLVDLSA